MTTIRQQIEKLVRDRLYELGETSIYEAAKGRDSIFDGSLCTYINPLCPGDLCYLPYDHVGAKTGWHVTGTVPYSGAVKWHYKKMAPEGTNRDRLYDLGWEEARRLWPE